MSYPKSFTVEEANALIPLVEETLETIGQRLQKARRHREKLHILDALWGADIKRQNNPDHAEFSRRTRAISDLLEEANRIARSQLLDRGLRLPDGFYEHGIVDFPTTYEGRWVFLCWRQGESGVSFWHEIDAGYAGRQEVTAEHVILMGRDDPQ